MWTNSRTAGASLRILNHLHHCCGHTGWRRGTDGRYRGLCRRMSSSGPPWRLLFFGSDHFAVESLKRLTSSWYESDRRLLHTIQCLVIQMIYTNYIVWHLKPKHVRGRQGCLLFWVIGALSLLGMLLGASYFSWCFSIAYLDFHVPSKSTGRLQEINISGGLITA